MHICNVTTAELNLHHAAFFLPCAASTACLFYYALIIGQIIFDDFNNIFSPFSPLDLFFLIRQKSPLLWGHRLQLHDLLLSPPSLQRRSFLYLRYMFLQEDVWYFSSITASRYLPLSQWKHQSDI